MVNVPVLVSDIRADWATAMVVVAGVEIGVPDGGVAVAVAELVIEPASMSAWVTT